MSQYRALASLVLASGLLLAGCSTTVPNRDPVGETFPTVTGEDLNGTTRSFPAEVRGAPAVLLVGYVQETQFDLDRWIYGLLDAQLPVKLFELPTIPDLIPSVFLQGTIDDGMRAGIPKLDWGGVVTLYGEQGEPVLQLTGNETPRNTRVLLVDADGRVVWFHDEGYSPRVLLELRDTLARLEAAPERATPP